MHSTGYTIPLTQLDFSAHSPQFGYYAISASAVLWVRCFSELVIVIHFHLQQNPAGSGTDAARYFIDGLCTSVFFVLVTRASGDVSLQERRDPVTELIQEDVRRHVNNAIEDAKEAPGGLPPVLADVFRDIRADPAAALSDETKTRLGDKTPDVDVTEYVTRLEGRYGTLRPVDRSREY
jgi:hypothetical protein